MIFRSLICLALIASAAPTLAANSTVTPQDVARIAGSVQQTTATTQVAAAVPSVSIAHVAAESVDDVTAVCLTTQSNLSACSAGVAITEPTNSGCGGSASYDADTGTISEPSAYCHGRTEPVVTHPAHVAVCDVEDVGFSGCLSKYADALVKHAPRARQTFFVMVQTRDGQMVDKTVLMPRGKSGDEAAQFALAEFPGGKVVGVIQ